MAVDSLFLVPSALVSRRASPGQVAGGLSRNFELPCGPPQCGAAPFDFFYGSPFASQIDAISLIVISADAAFSPLIPFLCDSIPCDSPNNDHESFLRAAPSSYGDPTAFKSPGAVSQLALYSRPCHLLHFSPVLSHSFTDSLDPHAQNRFRTRREAPAPGLTLRENLITSVLLPHCSFENLPPCSYFL